MFISNRFAKFKFYYMRILNTLILRVLNKLGMGIRISYPLSLNTLRRILLGPSIFADSLIMQCVYYFRINIYSCPKKMCQLLSYFRRQQTLLSALFLQTCHSVFRLGKSRYITKKLMCKTKHLGSKNKDFLYSQIRL